MNNNPTYSAYYASPAAVHQPHSAGMNSSTIPINNNNNNNNIKSTTPPPIGNTTSISTATTPKLHNLLNSSDSNNLSTMSLPLSSTSNALHNVVDDNHTVKSLSPPALDEISHTNNEKDSKSSKKKSSAKKAVATDEKSLLSTSSPEGIAAASQITPNRIASILIAQGPLPIRHLTGHLIEQVPAFGNLSLSKQRRLIMSALESGDLITGCIFEKIGWGQWEAKIVGEDIVKAKIESSINTTNNANNNTSAQNTKDVDMTDAPQSQHHAPVVKSEVSPKPLEPKPSVTVLIKSRTKSASRAKETNRRESITSQSNDNFRVPTSPSLGPVQNFRNSLKSYADIDEAIESSSDDDDDFDNDYDEYEDFNLNNSSADSPPMMDNVYNTSINSVNSINNTNKKNKIPVIRSPSVSSSRRPSFAGILKPRKPRSSFNQHTLEVALDEAPLERRESRVSFSNSANLSRQSFLRTNISPRLSNNDSNISIHDKENENAIADDDDDDDDLDGNFTDEEDWQAIGPSSLRNNRRSSVLTPPTPNLLDSHSNGSSSNPGNSNNTNHIKSDEEMAAIALMDLKTV